MHGRDLLSEWTEREIQSLDEVAGDVVRRALEAAGVDFIPENGGGPGVRLREKGGKQ